MMTIIDILIYVSFAFFASHLAKKSENYIEENCIDPTIWDKYLTYFVLFFTIIGGIRWFVGSDFISYATGFAYKPINFESNEKLWAYLIYTFQSLGMHWAFGLALCMFIQIYFITKTLQPYRWLLVFLPFVFFGGRYWMDCTSAIRQMIVACVFLWASRFIVEKKMLYYIAVIVVGSLIHHSALILLPLYLIPNRIDLTNKRWLLLFILIGSIALGQISALSGLSSYIKIIADTTNYNNYGGLMSTRLLNGYNDETLSFGPMMLSYMFLPIFIIWYGPELKKKYANHIHYFDLWFNLAFFYACAYFLLCNMGHLFIRPVMYFSLFQMILGTLLLRHLWTEYKLYGYRIIATISFCCIVATNTCWNICKVSGRPFEYITYKVSFLHKDEQKWFKL